MDFYACRYSVLPGTNYKEVMKIARKYFRSEIESKTKRKAYIRSRYFDKKKIFFDHYWIHLAQKVPPERMRRVIFLPAAIELLQNSNFFPETTMNPNKVSEKLHRFGGITACGKKFYVQVKQNGEKLQLMSTFKAK